MPNTKLIAKKDLPALLFLLLFDLVLFNRFLSDQNSMIYPSVEVVRQEFFWKAYLKTSLAENGAVPLWDPNIYSGTVYLAMPNHSIFFPLNILYIVLPIHRAAGFNMILDVFLAGIFCYFLAKTFGLSKAAASASAVTYMFSGTIVSQVFAGNISQINAMVWLPLILAFLELSIKTGRMYLAALGGAAWALMILSGHLQYPVYGIFLAGVYALVRCMASGDKKLVLHAKMLAVLVAVGFLAASARLLPVFEFSALSTRSSGLSLTEASQDSMRPMQLVNALIPDAFGNHVDRTYWGASNFAEASIYVGFVPLALAVASVLYSRNRPVKVFAVLAALSLVLMLGNYTPLFGALAGMIKPLAMFKTPVRFAFGFVIATAMLAGFGYDAIGKKTSKYGKLKLACFIIAAASVVALVVMVLGKTHIIENGYSMAQAKFTSKSSNVSDQAIYEYYYANSGALVEKYYNRLLENVAVLAVSSAGLGMFLSFSSRNRKGRVRNLVPIALIVFALLQFGYKFTPAENPESIFYTPAFMGSIKDLGLGRVLAPIDVLPQHIAIRENITLAAGYSEIIGDYSRYLSYALGNNGTGYSADVRVSGLKRPVMLNDLGVRYFVLTERLAGYPVVFEGDAAVKNELHRISYNKTIYVYRNDYARPKMFVTNRFIVLPDGNMSELETILEGGYISLDARPSMEIRADVPVGYNITIDKYEPHSVVASVAADQNSVLVLGDVWYPGWRATVDGRKVDIMKADSVIRAIELPKGAHKVEFIYTPASAYLGVLASVFGLAILAYLFYRKV